MAANFGRRFDELITQAETVDATKRMEHRQYGVDGYRIDQNEFLNWRVKARHLINSICGPDSQHFKIFLQAEKSNMYETSHEVFLRLRAVLLAAKEDYEGGYLHKIKHLIQADVFENELDQADELLASGYKAAAAVIAGVVLETSLRDTCADNAIAPGKLDKMNADLAKADVYNKLTQKQITALADVRNNAAHGKYDQFDEKDVANMIRDVRNLLASQLT